MAEYKKLDPEFKAKWLKALRSGEYRQGHGFLKSDYGFCCLGVLCDTLDHNTWRKSAITGGKYLTYNGGKYLTYNGGSYYPAREDLPESQFHILKQTDINPDPDMITAQDRDVSVMRRIAWMNDSEKYTFEDIASWIEENL